MSDLLIGLPTYVKSYGIAILYSMIVRHVFNIDATNPLNWGVAIAIGLIPLMYSNS